jgi:hypothetical protein
MGNRSLYSNNPPGNRSSNNFNPPSKNHESTSFLDQAGSGNALVPARLKDESIDGFRSLQLGSSHHKIAWRPELT